eukprot:448596-Pyramimonas_sp.AAC.2
MTAWLHVQLVGHKRVVLYPPSEADLLYVEGSSSRVADVDQPDLEAFPLFSEAKGRLETTLAPGEVLYLPGLWFHHVTACGDSASVAVNVFWKSLPAVEYDPADVYGRSASTLQHERTCEWYISVFSLY